MSKQPIEVLELDQKHVSLKGDSLSRPLDIREAFSLADRLREAAQKLYREGYLNGKISLESFAELPRVKDLLDDVRPSLKDQPTCETLDDLLGKLQDFIQKYPKAEVATADTPSKRLWGYWAFYNLNGFEVSLYETICSFDMKMSPELRLKVMPFFKATGGGRLRFTEALKGGTKFV
jgi:hypothetical protein